MSSKMNGRGNRSLSQSSIPQTPAGPGLSRESSNAWSLHSFSSASLNTIGSTAFWHTPPRRPAWRSKRWRVSDLLEYVKLRKVRPWMPNRRALICVSLIMFIMTSLYNCVLDSKELIVNFDAYEPPLAALPSTLVRSTDPVQWLRENSNDKYAVSSQDILGFRQTTMGGRPRAAIISLVRNTELKGMLQSMRQLEDRWNHKYQYPWVFFNDEPFTEEFKMTIQNLTSAECHFAVIPVEHWSLPDWIDEDRFMNGLEYLGTIGVGKGWMASYHHMCRWNSGFFYKHPILKNIDWYWRVEPDVQFLCDIDYDVFRFMRDNNLKYGFNMNILDDARSFPSLWSHTRKFMSRYSHLVHPDADLEWLLDSQNNHEYNNCQFFSNFEVGSLNFWRGRANEAYFNFIDKSGGFYYERVGDAPVHTLSIAMFLPKSEVWYFRDIGYQHDINLQCPAGLERKCSCQPTRLDENFYKLVPILSPQPKPTDTCIRQWLGGEWLKKKEGWTMEGEKAFGGDGYHGYIWE